VCPVRLAVILLNNEELAYDEQKLFFAFVMLLHRLLCQQILNYQVFFCKFFEWLSLLHWVIEHGNFWTLRFHKVVCGMFINDFIANLLMSLSVTKFGKSVGKVTGKSLVSCFLVHSIVPVFIVCTIFKCVLLQCKPFVTIYFYLAK